MHSREEAAINHIDIHKVPQMPAGEVRLGSLNVFILERVPRTIGMSSQKFRHRENLVMLALCWRPQV